MDGIRAGFLVRVTTCTLLCLLFGLIQNYDVRAADSCITCHTDEEKLTNSLGKVDTGKSALQAGPG